METPEAETPAGETPAVAAPEVAAPKDGVQRAQWVLGALALLLIVALALLLIGRFAPARSGIATPGATLAPPSASVAALQGPVFACAQAPEGACNMPANLGQLVFVGGEVRTGDTGTVDMQTRTTVFRLGNSTQVHFRDVSDAVTQVVLAIGRLFASHDPGGRSVVRVQSGQVTVQAIDTRFSVEARTGGGVYVAVPPGGGQVTILTGATAASITLLAGQEILINPNINAPLAPRPLNPDEQARWAVVSCGWQAIAARLTPVALPPAQCASPTVPPTVPPTATHVPPTATPIPPTETLVPVLPTDTPGGQPASPLTPTLTVPPGRLITSYLATWLNTDRQTTGPAKLTLTNKATTLTVQWYKICATHICAQTTTSAPFGAEPFTILSPEKHKIRFTLEKDNTVLLLDDSDARVQYTFRRVVVRDYTGTWINNDTTGAALPQLGIRNLSSKIIVDWSSGCFNADCNSSGVFSSEPIATDRFALSLDNLAGTQLQVDDLVQSVTYYFHK